MNSGNAVFDGINAVLKLRKHTSSQTSAVHELLSLLYLHFRDQGILVLKIPVNAFHIRQKCQLFRLYRPCNGAGRVIGIDIVALEMIVIGNGADNGQEILFQKFMNQFRVYLIDLAYIADILTAGVFFMAF